jgi:hypothetical protein
LSVSVIAATLGRVVSLAGFIVAESLFAVAECEIIVLNHPVRMVNNKSFFIA